jgi:anti-anti-sigma factor
LVAFAVSTHRTECCEVIELAGELDFGTAPHLEAVLDRLMVIPDHIIIDTSELTFIDSTGLRLMLRASTLVEGRIWLRGPSRQVLRLLVISGLSKSFCLDEDPELAHASISQRRAG